MFNKPLCTALLLSLLPTTALYAEGNMPAPLEVDLCDGYYVGVGIGVASLINKTDITGAISINDRFGYTGVAAGVHGGYSWNFGDYYNIGLEGFFNYTDINTAITAINPARSARYKSNWLIGMKLLPALQFSPSTRIFAALGVAWTYSKFYSSTLAQTTAGAAATYVRTAPGLVLGLGINTAVNNSLSIRGEYDYISTDSWGFSSTLNTVALNTSFKRYTNIVLISLNYNLCC